MHKMKQSKEKLDHFTIEIGLKFVIITAVNIKMIFVPVCRHHELQQQQSNGAILNGFELNIV